MHLFLIVCGIFLVIGSMFPLSVEISLPSSTKPSRWIQNCLPFSVYMLSAFPIAMGIFAVTIAGLKNNNGIDVFAATTYASASGLYVSVAALLFLWTFASVIVLNDFTSRPVAPYILRGPIAAEAFLLEKELRAAAKRRRRTTSKRRPSKAATQTKPKRTAVPISTIRQYQRLVQLNSLREILKHGNLVTAAYLGIAWVGTLCCTFYFWYVAILVLSNQKLPEGTISRLLTVFVLLITWFPMRLHMDWYQNYFHNRAWLKKSNGFWMGIVVASASLVFVVFITKPEAIALVCAVLNALVLLFVGLAGKFKPEWLRVSAEAYQSMPFVYFFGSYITFLFVTVAIGIRILGNG